MSEHVEKYEERVEQYVTETYDIGSRILKGKMVAEEMPYGED